MQFAKGADWQKGVAEDFAPTFKEAAPAGVA